MSSIDSPKIVQTILENNGVFPGDPQYHAIFQYENMFGGVTYKLCMSETDIANFIIHGSFKDYKELYYSDIGLTSYGKDWLRERRNEEQNQAFDQET